MARKGMWAKILRGIDAGMPVEGLQGSLWRGMTQDFQREKAQDEARRDEIEAELIRGGSTPEAARAEATRRYRREVFGDE